MKHKTVTPKLTITSKTGGISIFPGKKYAYKLDKTDRSRIINVPVDRFNRFEVISLEEFFNRHKPKHAAKN